MGDKVEREQILAFRLAAHHLISRALPEDILEIAGACGVQDSPPGSAALALNARIEGLTLQQLEKCLISDRTLVELWCMRGAPYLVPANEAAVFTTGLLPDDEASCRFFIQGATEHLRLFGLQATKIVAHTAQCLPQILDGRQLTKDELGKELALSVEAYLPGDLRLLWRKPDGIGQNTYGESLVRYALYVVALSGSFCILPKMERSAVKLKLTAQWLGHTLPVMDARQARAELVRRFLHCYGPATPQAFARWSGASANFAAASFNLIEDELISVEFGGKPLFLRRQDSAKLLGAVRPHGVRLLPPGDPYLALQHKPLLLPDTALHKKIWKSSANPGVVLADGEIVATWRPQKRGSQLLIWVEPLIAGLPAHFRREIESEAQRIAPLRQAREVIVRV